MADRTEILNGIYNRIDENSRLVKSRAGELEFITTMNYIHRFLKAGDTILETGAGTGRYSVRLAKEGYEVTAVELVEKNLEELKRNAEKSGLPENRLKALSGDAASLSELKDESFDMTLVLGPMYHLYEKEDVEKAVNESLRVTKKGGILMFAFLSVHAIMMTEYLFSNFEAGLKENFDKDYTVRHFKEQGFTGYRIPDFEKLFDGKNVTHITTLATDGPLELAEKNPDFHLSDHNFNLLCKYHLANCENREILGESSHLLYIGRKI